MTDTVKYMYTICIISICTRLNYILCLNIVLMPGYVDVHFRFESLDLRSPQVPLAPGALQLQHSSKNPYPLVTVGSQNVNYILLTFLE